MEPSVTTGALSVGVAARMSWIRPKLVASPTAPPITAMTVDDEIIKLRDFEGVSSIVVTHQLRDAIHADQIVVFEQGRVVESGTHTSLLVAAGTYASLWQQQERRLQARD